MNYLSVGTDAKTVKGEKKGFMTGILYLAPAKIAGGETICPFSRNISSTKISELNSPLDW